MDNEFLKDVFGEDSLDYDTLSSKLQEKGIKLADLSTGKYVDKKKYDDDVASWQGKYNDAQSQYDEIMDALENAEDEETQEYNAFMKQFDELKKSSEATAKELDLYKKKETMRANGIDNQRFMDLAMFELRDSKDFEADIKKWAEDNKALITPPKADDKKGGYRSNAKLGGNPDTDDGKDDAFMKGVMKGAGLKPEDLKDKK